MYKLPPNFRRQEDGIQQVPHWRPKTLETCEPHLFCAFCSERVKWCTKGKKYSNYAKYSRHHHKKVSRPGRSGASYFCTPGYGIIKDKDISSPAKKRSACKNDLANEVKRTRFQNFEQCNYSVFVPIMAVSWLRQTPAPAQARIRSQASPWGICGEKVALGHVSLRVFRCSSCLYHPTHTHTDI